MAIDLDNTITLDSAAVSAGMPVRSADLVKLLKRINALEEMIEDTEATGGSVGSVTYRGHDHDPGSAGTPARGIMRMVDGNFQIIPDSVAMTAACSTAAPISVASVATYSGMFETTGAFGFSAIMGKIHVSPGIEEVRVETCWKVDDLTGSPQFRVKNLTDTTNKKFYGSGWIAIDTTSSPRWYGANAEDIAIVPISKSTSIKEVDFDIEIRVVDNATTTQFDLYAAFPYEAVNEK